jgi:hypothetical protein
VGRLEDIVARNKNPKGRRMTWSFGVRSLLLLVILAILIFSNLAEPPADNRPGINIVPPKDPAVRDVKLWSPPKQKPKPEPKSE